MENAGAKSQNTGTAGEGGREEKREGGNAPQPHADSKSAVARGAARLAEAEAFLAERTRVRWRPMGREEKKRRMNVSRRNSA